MRSSFDLAILKLFPPPRFLTMPHAGLDISDDGMRCIRYDGSARDRRIGAFGAEEFPDGLMDGGDAKDEADFAARLAAFARAHNLHRVKVSVPEEKAYLFQAEVSGSDARAIAENIEFKLEENVPLSPADALFYFELLPPSAAAPRRASVSVVPRSYIERYAAIVRKAGMSPVAFEIAPKAIARAVTFPHGSETSLIVHRMRHKTGMHVAVGGALSFTSTVGDTEPEKLAREASKIYSYWVSRDPEHPISGIIVVGHDGQAFEDALRAASGADLRLPIRSGHVWQNAFSLERAIPPISVEDSLEYAVAAGLAFDLSEPF